MVKVNKITPQGAPDKRHPLFYCVPQCVCMQLLEGK